MRQELLIIVGILVIFFAVYLRERSWNNALLKVKEELLERQVQFDNSLELLKIEKANNQYSTFITFQFAEKCLGTPLIDPNETDYLNPQGVIELYQSRLQRCHEALISETPLKDNSFLLLLNNTTSSSSGSALAEVTVKLTLLSPGRLLDRWGWSCLLLLVCLILSETFLLYNLSSPQPFKINGKTYEQGDFLEKPLGHALEGFLIKEHPFTSFLFSLALHTFLLVLYFLSFIVSWSNAYYYRIFYRLIQVLIVYSLASIVSFLAFNGFAVSQFLHKMYKPKTFYQIIAEQYRKREFWLMIAMKMFRVYDFYDLLLTVFWFGAHFLFLLPLLFLFYYYDSLYLHSDMTSTSSMNQSNHFMLLSFLHLFFPFVCCYFLAINTFLLPFLPPQKNPKATFLYEPLIFSSKKSWLRSTLDFFLRKNIFYFDRGENTTSEQQKTLKSQDMRMGLLFFVNAGNSVLYLLRFLYIVLFKKLTMTWFAYLNNWCFIAFHIFILLYTLPVINVLLYKYEIMRKYRNIFHQQIMKKFEEGMAAGSGTPSMTPELVQEEIEVGLNLFDFALHKAVLYCLLIHRDENQEGQDSPDKKKAAEEKNDVSMRLERIFTSFLQSDAFAFGVKFAPSPNEEKETDEDSEHGSGEERNGVDTNEEDIGRTESGHKEGSTEEKQTRARKNEEVEID